MNVMGYYEIQLNSEEIESCTKYEKSFGKIWVEKALEYAKANKYLELTCNINRESRKKGNCFNIGTVTYTRKDGEPIQIQDFDALQVMDHGQFNKRTIADDGMSMSHYWECDSGD